MLYVIKILIEKSSWNDIFTKQKLKENSSYGSKVHHWLLSRPPSDGRQRRVCPKVPWVLFVYTIYIKIVGRTHQKLSPQQCQQLLLKRNSEPKVPDSLLAFSVNSEGTPKSLNTLSRKIFATKEALRPPLPTKQGISPQYLINTSTWWMVKIALCPLKRGWSVIKPIF